MLSGRQLKSKVREWAAELGFQQVGFAQAERLEEEAPRLEEWLQRNYHGKMAYMANWLDVRLDPRLLVDDAKTVIVFTFNYFTNKKQVEGAPKISKYAFGEDYHSVLKDKLKEIVFRMKAEVGAFNARAFVDSAPVMERAWAQKAGLGWRGKHTLLINKQQGSFFFLAVVVTDLAIDPDEPFRTDHCGTCTRCIDACPTDAIVEPYLLDASKCISYLTIELKDAIPESFRGRMENWAFGCDICQDVCPWNRFSTPHQETKFDPSERFLNMNREEWMEITEDLFREIFPKSAVRRTKFSGFRRNLEFLK